MPNISWSTYADMMAFIGNSLLLPLSRTEKIGIDPRFWEELPDFGNGEVASAIDACATYARNARQKQSEGIDVVQEISVEYTQLFIGPPQPLAAPWETMNGKEEVTVGFGEPTFAMQRVLRSLGLEMSNENNQYADHMGIELLALSEMCRRLASTGDETLPASRDGHTNGSEETPTNITGTTDVTAITYEDVTSFITEHPLAWIGRFKSKVSARYPDGYYDLLLGLAEALLKAAI